MAGRRKTPTASSLGRNGATTPAARQTLRPIIRLAATPDICCVVSFRSAGGNRRCGTARRPVFGTLPTFIKGRQLRILYSSAEAHRCSQRLAQIPPLTIRRARDDTEFTPAQLSKACLLPGWRRHVQRLDGSAPIARRTAMSRTRWRRKGVDSMARFRLAWQRHAMFLSFCQSVIGAAFVDASSGEHILVQCELFVFPSWTGRTTNANGTATAQTTARTQKTSI
jgi:hypothetical protein